MSDSTRRRLIVADDEPAVRHVLQLLLEQAGFEVVAVSDGIAALAAAEATPAVGALIDLRMPGWSGIETMQRLRAVFPALPIVLLTGHGDVPTAVNAIQLGADDFLQKPCDRGDLLAAVVRAIRRRHPRRSQPATSTPATPPAAGPASAPTTTPAAATASADHRVAEALRHVEATGPAERCSLTQVAARLRVSPSHLNRLIERETGQSFTAHERAARMTLAATLLQTTTLSVKEVAAHVGYSHASSFDRWFRRTFAATPGEYRRQGLAAPEAPQAAASVEPAAGDDLHA